MKIAIIAPTSIPSPRANTIQVMKMSQAFANLGYEVDLFVPLAEKTNQNSYNHSSRYKPGHDNLHTRLPGAGQEENWDALVYYYGLQSIPPAPGAAPAKFSITWLPSQDHLRRYDYALRAVRRAYHTRAALIYTRLPQAAALASLAGKPTIFEVHDLPHGRAGKLFFSMFLRGRGRRRLVAITKALADDLRLSSAPAPQLNQPAFTIIAPDGVDLARYENLPDPTTARSMLQPNLPERFTLGYTGHLYAGRGMENLLKLASCLPDANFLVVGGGPDQVADLKSIVQDQGLANMFIAGFVANAELPLYQAACEALLMPYQRQVAASSGGDIARYLSPMKVFEYMACGRAIISSDLPVLREVLNPLNSILLSPDDLEAWVKALQDIRTDTELRMRLSAQAHSDARLYTWEKRAQRILDKIEPAIPVG